MKLDTTSIISGGFQVNINENINILNQCNLSDSLEAFIRLIYEEISDESGLYFITEIKNRLSRDHLNYIDQLGLNLDKIQNEQHMLYNNRKRKNEQLKLNKNGN